LAPRKRLSPALTASPVILRREQPPLRVKISEPGVRIITRILLAAVHRAQPHNAVPLIDPGSTTERPDPQAINHRLDDAENTLWPLRRHRSDTTQLLQPGTLKIAHADVQTR